MKTKGPEAALAFHALIRDGKLSLRQCECVTCVQQSCRGKSASAAPVLVHANHSYTDKGTSQDTLDQHFPPVHPPQIRAPLRPTGELQLKDSRPLQIDGPQHGKAMFTVKKANIHTFPGSLSVTLQLKQKFTLCGTLLLTSLAL